MEFIGKEAITCHPANNETILRQKGYHLGCHCIETNEKCKEILWFLTLDGRFNIKSNTEIIYREATTSFAYTHVKDFNDMMEKVVLQIFEKRFKEKNANLISKSVLFKKVAKINTKDACIQYGPDCIASLQGLNDILNRIFRISFVLNKDLVLENTNSITQIRERYYGTLLVNRHFDYLNELHQRYPVTNEAFQIGTDLEKLFRLLTTSQNLTQFLEMLGYADDSFGSRLDISDHHILTPNSQSAEDSDLFKRSNENILMSILKYSLDLSDPWIPHYYNKRNNQDRQSEHLTRNLYKAWLTEADNDIKKLLLNAPGIDILQGWRYVSYYKMYCLCDFIS